MGGSSREEPDVSKLLARGALEVFGIDLRSQREIDPEDRASGFGTLHVHPAAVALDDFVGDRQPEPRALVLPFGVEGGGIAL